MPRASQPRTRAGAGAIALLATLASACQFDRAPIVPIYHGQLHVPQPSAAGAPAAGSGCPGPTTRAANGGAAGCATR